ncbi:MAG: hypothetical protein JNK17_15975 [Hydrogenophaga sp.]|nr:hypothetical protein [Hydrogenophaga sp.]
MLTMPIPPHQRQPHWTPLTGLNALHRAWTQAALGKRSQPEVARFELNLGTALLQLQAELRSGNYRPSGYRSFVIHDPKRRLVSAAPFRDRVVHHALVQAIEPLFEKHFIEHSYANRIGKGTHKAIAQARQWQCEHAHVLQCDLRQFFPSVDHAVLLGALARRITCPRTLVLCATVLRSGVGVLDGEYTPISFPGDDLLAAARPRGLPIGNLTSQFWANVLLNELDQFVTAELGCAAYLRYVDDFLLFSDNKKQLWQWKAAIREKLNALRLSMHEASSTVYPVKNGIPWLGVRLLPQGVKLKTRNARAFSARLRDMQAAIAAGQMPLKEATWRINGWVAHAKQADSWALRRAIFEQALFIPPPQPTDEERDA